MRTLLLAILTLAAITGCHRKKPAAAPANPGVGAGGPSGANVATAPAAGVGGGSAPGAKASPELGTKAPPSLASALNFGERKAEQIHEILDGVEKLNCIDTPLLDIYACQVGRFAEAGTYSASLTELGCVPEQPQCKGKWSYNLELTDGGKGFLANAFRAKTGEIWQINQGKEIVQARPPAPPPPPAEK